MNSISFKKTTAVWIILLLVLFVVAIVLGIAMRFNQGDVFRISSVGFYSIMTAHGVTMIGIWSCAGLIAINYLLGRYVRVSSTLSIFALVCTIIGILMLWTSTFIGDFHAGWTFLYPLPFFEAWAKWATPLFLLSLSVMGIGWLVWTMGMMLQILNHYSLSQVFAWQHFSKKPSVETPPLILIASVSLFGIIVCLLFAVLLLVMFFAEYLSAGSFANDPLLMKNITFFFGHTIANEALYLGLATLYELMPEISGRPKFKTTWYVALGWNCSLVFILTAFFHHLYMDFVQPEGFQLIGQLASYFASIPAVVVTVFSVAMLVFRNKIKWTIVNLLFFVGVMGWVIGGVGALIDATISNNLILHNTLWVPAHFHTYNAMGNVLFSLAFFIWIANEFSKHEWDNKRNKLVLLLLLVGGFGFVLMFYLGGAQSIPRRFSIYPKDFTQAQLLASAGAWFACVYLLAVLFLIFEIIRKCTKVFSAS